MVSPVDKRFNNVRSFVSTTASRLQAMLHLGLASNLLRPLMCSHAAEEGRCITDVCEPCELFYISFLLTD